MAYITCIYASRGDIQMILIIAINNLFLNYVRLDIRKRELLDARFRERFHRNKEASPLLFGQLGIN